MFLQNSFIMRLVNLIRSCIAVNEKSKQVDAQCGRYYECSVHHCKVMANIIQEENRCKFVFINIWICELKVSDLNVHERVRNSCPVQEVCSLTVSQISYVEYLQWIRKKGNSLLVNAVITSHSTVDRVLVWTWCFSYNAFVLSKEEGSSEEYRQFFVCQNHVSCGEMYILHYAALFS